MANVAEHRIEVPAPPAGKGAAAAAAAAEKRMNGFVHLVALIERTGNALGTLAFTWATVVLLGGYPTVLRPTDDFWFATTVVFLEAARMFSRDNRPDYQLFFRTRGALKSLGWNGLILTVCFLDVMVYVMIWIGQWIPLMPFAFLVILAIGRFLLPGAARLFISNSLSGAITLWSPMVAIILLGPSVPYSYDDNNKRFIARNSIAKLTVYLVLLVVVLLLIVSKLRSPGIIKLVDCAMGRKLVSWRRFIINSCLFAATVMLVFTFDGVYLFVIIGIQAYALLIVSVGNLQFPAAVLRIALASVHLASQKYYSDGELVDKENLEEKTNLVPSLNIFYGMVLGQGILYIAACILEVFSFFLRRSLVRRAGFRGQLGVQYVNLYYAYAFEKCMGGAVLAPKKISLITFAMDSLKSDSTKMQLHGVQMLHSFLKNEPFKTKAISKLTASTKTVTSLFNMLGRTSEGDKDIRSFAAKVTNELADSLQVAPIPGAMQLVASLLDTVHQLEMKDPLLDTDSQEAKQDALIQRVSRDGHNSPMLKWWKQMAIYCLIPAEEPYNMDEHSSCMPRCWKRIAKCWSVPEEEPLTDQDLLPVLGMSILDRLGSFHLENCMEITRATGLIAKIIEFTSNRNNMININEAHQTLLKAPSLKVLRRLASTKGRFGVTLRQKISEHPFLLSNLAEILDDSGSSQELRELTAEILRNLAMDGNIREEIGHIRVIISRLLHAFLNRGAPSSTDSDQLLRMIAGQALAVLAMESDKNCLVMLAEPGYVFIKELTIMIHSERYRYIAASLLRNMCMHARPDLSNSDLKELCHILREVLEGIMDAEGAELEILVGLSSQICNVIPDDFVREVEHGQIKERFIKRLVNALKSNMIPTANCPGIRRVIVEHATYMIECNPSYVNCFNKCWMMEALSMVERTPSRAENYRFFLGDAGLMEHSIPLSALVARAKELMGREWLRGFSNVT